MLRLAKHERGFFSGIHRVICASVPDYSVRRFVVKLPIEFIVTRFGEPLSVQAKNKNRFFAAAQMTLKGIVIPESFGCHSEQREESQDKVREGSGLKWVTTGRITEAA